MRRSGAVVEVNVVDADGVLAELGFARSRRRDLNLLGDQHLGRPLFVNDGGLSFRHPLLLYGFAIWTSAAPVGAWRVAASLWQSFTEYIACKSGRRAS